MIQTNEIRNTREACCGINMTFPSIQLSRAFQPFLTRKLQRDKKQQTKITKRRQDSKVKSRLNIRLRQIDEFPPCVGENKVLDTSLGVVENMLIETRDIQTASVAARR
jgi:hypothetical protein